MNATAFLANGFLQLLPILAFTVVGVSAGVEKEGAIFECGHFGTGSWGRAGVVKKGGDLIEGGNGNGSGKKDWRKIASGLQ